MRDQTLYPFEVRPLSIEEGGSKSDKFTQRLPESPHARLATRARQLSTLDRLKLIRILAEDLEAIGDIFPFQAGKTYELPTPYGMVSAAAMLAEAMASYHTTDISESEDVQ